MGLNNLLTEIHKAIQKAVLIVGKYPNKIVIGANVYQKFRLSPPMVYVDTDYSVARMLYGIPVTIDYDNKDKIYVGYMQEIEVGEIDGK